MSNLEDCRHCDGIGCLSCLPKPAHIDTTAPVVLKSELQPEEDECQRCWRTMNIEDGCERTKYCHPCAQELVTAFEASQPNELAAAQASFEEWWKDGEVIQRLPPASESFDKAIARLTWNAQQAKIDALEQRIQPVEKSVSDEHLALVNFYSGLHGANFPGFGTPDDESNMARELQQYRQRAESRIAELEEKLREGK